MHAERSSAFILGGLVALGLALAGYFIADAAHSLRGAQRVVAVKGLAEREVEADLALWSLAYTTTADDLPTLHQRLDTDAQAIIDFLGARGFKPEEATRASPVITDRQDFGAQWVGERYQAQAVMLLRSGQVAAVRAAQSQTQELIAADVTLNRNYDFPTEFLYTDLNSIKPEMIAQATRDARAAAEQFAQDSGSRVGAIRSARQGYFSIEDRDRLSPQIKRVRVVTSVEYFLED